VRANAGDFSKVLTEFNKRLAVDHAGYFNSQSSPSGEGWAALSPVTVKKKGHSVILFETGALRDSLTSIGTANNISTVAERGSLFGTSDEKSLFHTLGTAKMPKREHVGTNDDAVDDLADAVGNHIVESLKFKTG
jgi:phage gpG-like protein